MWLKFLIFLKVFISFLSIDLVIAIKWPKCGEFVIRKDDYNLSAEEKQFKQNLPLLFESFDCGNVTNVENTLKSLEKFKVSFTSDKKCLEKQTLSPSQEIVSIINSLLFIHIDF